jgi:diketogulonate reductase-like aldo/keto reductase
LGIPNFGILRLNYVVLSGGDNVMTIPGTTRLENPITNLGAHDIELTGDEQSTLDRLADQVKGDRYDERGMSIING